MSFNAYLENIRIKTGKTADEFKRLAENKGFLKPGTKAGEVVAWLKNDFGLGHGHAMAIYMFCKGEQEKPQSMEDRVGAHFTRGKGSWRTTFDELLNNINGFGDDISVDAGKTYITILRGSKKVAILKISVSKMEVGIKLKGLKPTKRFRSAEHWNAMVTHRVEITERSQIDKELISWLRSAYEQNG